MQQPFVWISTYRIKPGQEKEYKRLFQEVNKIVEEKEPRMIHFATYYSENGSEASTFMIHPDADHMIFHMKTVGEHIQKAMPLIDMVDVRIYGKPTEELMKQVRQFGSHPIHVMPDFSGFTRLPGLDQSVKA